MDRRNPRNIIPNFHQQNSCQKVHFFDPYALIRDLQKLGIIAGSADPGGDDREAVVPG